MVPSDPAILGITQCFGALSQSPPPSHCPATSATLALGELCVQDGQRDWVSRAEKPSPGLTEELPGEKRPPPQLWLP